MSGDFARLRGPRIKWLPSKHLLVLKTSSTRLKHKKFTSSKTSWRRLEDILQEVLKTTWKRKNCYTENVLKASWRRVLKTSWRNYGDKQNAYWGHLHLTNLNIYLKNIYFANLYLTFLRQFWHQNSAASKTFLGKF